MDSRRREPIKQEKNYYCKTEKLDILHIHMLIFSVACTPSVKEQNVIWGWPDDGSAGKCVLSKSLTT